MKLTEIVTEANLIKNLKRMLNKKDLKSRISQEITAGFDAEMKGDRKESRRRFKRFDKLDKLGAKQ